MKSQTIVGALVLSVFGQTFMLLDFPKLKIKIVKIQHNNI